MNLIIYIDGAARGNPGPAGAGAVIRAGGHTYHLSKYLGNTTNNRAEYQALILAFNKAVELFKKRQLEVKKIVCYSDSELLVKQMKQEYKVKDEELGKLFVMVWNLSQQLPKIEFQHLPREKNKQADKLANQAIDSAPIV